MALDTVIKKQKTQNKTEQRWLRLNRIQPDLKELNSLFDLYWGGPERRLTGITIRIIGVNAIALIILMFGIIYVGQYQNAVINSRLEMVQSELQLIQTSLVQSIDQPLLQEQNLSSAIRDLIGNLSLTSRQRITILSPKTDVIADSFEILNTNHFDFFQEPPKNEYQSVQILKDMAALVLSLLPQRNNMPLYSENMDKNSWLKMDFYNAQQGQTSLSVWKSEEGHMILTAVAPLKKQNKIHGFLLLTRESQDIKNSINEIWLNVLKVFSLTLFFTILLSIYLSGVIARPLRKLAKAAEAVRSGLARAKDIPDLSARNDEIGELSLVIRQMTEALWARMDAIEQFAADVAHELKNPLTSLRSAVETERIVKNDADRKKLMEIIYHDVSRLDRLISDISKASRLDAELSREAFEKLNLSRLLYNFVDGYAAPLTRNTNTGFQSSKKVKVGEVTLTLYLGSSDLFVWGLENRLGQVFQNLISNALSFSPPNSEITISTSSHRGKISVVIEDQGPGIPETKLQTIFERFYSERPNHEAFGLHSGLGLSICRQIIDVHGGEIFAENIKDFRGNIKGARFIVILNKA